MFQCLPIRKIHVLTYCFLIVFLLLSNFVFLICCFFPMLFPTSEDVAAFHPSPTAWSWRCWRCCSYWSYWSCWIHRGICRCLVTTSTSQGSTRSPGSFPNHPKVEPAIGGRTTWCPRSLWPFLVLDSPISQAIAVPTSASWGSWQPKLSRWHFCSLKNLNDVKHSNLKF